MFRNVGQNQRRHCEAGSQPEKQPGNCPPEIFKHMFSCYVQQQAPIILPPVKILQVTIILSLPESVS